MVKSEESGGIRFGRNAKWLMTPTGKEPEKRLERLSHYQSREESKMADNRSFIDRGKVSPKFKTGVKGNQRIKMTFIVDECKKGLRGRGCG